MFSSDFNPKSDKVKLPKAVVMMVEKGNMVMAIKTLAADENISMDAAKARIDTYEARLQTQQQQKLSAIANKQGIPHDALTFDQESADINETELIKDHVKADAAQQNFTALQQGLDSSLDKLGYKKPLMPYWMKRVFIIVILMAGLFWIMWRVFG